MVLGINTVQFSNEIFPTFFWPFYFAIHHCCFFFKVFSISIFLDQCRLDFLKLLFTEKFFFNIFWTCFSQPPTLPRSSLHTQIYILSLSLSHKTQIQKSKQIINTTKTKHSEANKHCFLYVCEYYACMYVLHLMYAGYLQKSEQSIRSPWN